MARTNSILRAVFSPRRLGRLCALGLICCLLAGCVPALPALPAAPQVPAETAARPPVSETAPAATEAAVPAPETTLTETTLPLPETTQAPETTEPVPEGPLVEDLFREEFSIDQVPCLYSVPRINLQGPEIDLLNRYFEELLLPEAQESAAKAKSQGSDMDFYNEISYTWTFNGEVLSVLIHHNYYAYEAYSWEAYNISVARHCLIRDREMAELAGLTQEEYARKVREAITGGFFEFSAGANWDPNDDFLRLQLTRSLTAFKVDDAMPYFNEDGQLCVAADIYSLAGGDYYPHLLNLEDYTLPDNIEPFAGLLEEKRDPRYSSIEEPWRTFLQKQGLLMLWESEDMDEYCLLDVNQDGVDELLVQNHDNDFSRSIFLYDPLTERYRVGVDPGEGELLWSPTSHSLIAKRPDQTFDAKDHYTVCQISYGMMYRTASFLHDRGEDRYTDYDGNYLSTSQCEAYLADAEPVNFFYLH